jgi:hypothetical protein
MIKSDVQEMNDLGLGVGSSDRVSAYQAQGPEFKKEKKKEMNDLAIIDYLQQ